MQPREAVNSELTTCPRDVVATEIRGARSLDVHGGRALPRDTPPPLTVRRSLQCSVLYHKSARRATLRSWTDGTPIWNISDATEVCNECHEAIWQHNHRRGGNLSTACLRDACYARGEHGSNVSATAFISPYLKRRHIRADNGIPMLSP